MSQRTNSCVLVDKEKTSWFPGNIGVRKGDVTSPILFSLFIT